jgi:hypothetical protein
MDELSLQNMLRYGYNSWHRHDEKIYDWKNWTPTKLTLDGYRGNEDQYTTPAEWTQSLFNLVSESSPSVQFFTEKTWMPVLTEKPFVLNAAKHSHKKLEDWGFKSYDEIIDYDFDKYEGEKRIVKLVSFLKSNRKNDLNKLYDAVRDKLKYNREHARRLIQEKFLIPDEAYEYVNYVNLIRESTEKLYVKDTHI